MCIQHPDLCLFLPCVFVISPQFCTRKALICLPCFSGHRSEDFDLSREMFVAKLEPSALHGILEATSRTSWATTYLRTCLWLMCRHQ